jgi:hypothetical protein
VALTLLASVPRDAVLFLDGDNDSYPLWYAQQVEAVRRDVLLVTVPLLPASWYPAELARRGGLRWSDDEPVRGARTVSGLRAARIADAARRAGRPVAASPALPARERALLGADWVPSGAVYLSRRPRSGGPADGRVALAVAVAPRLRMRPLPRRTGAAPADDVAWSMLRLLECPGLADVSGMDAARRDSLEVTCNFR